MGLPSGICWPGGGASRHFPEPSLRIWPLGRNFQCCCAALGHGFTSSLTFSGEAGSQNCPTHCSANLRFSRPAAVSSHCWPFMYGLHGLRTTGTCCAMSGCPTSRHCPFKRLTTVPLGRKSHRALPCVSLHINGATFCM